MTDHEHDDDIEKELRGLQWDEISGVKYPANNLPGALLTKSRGFNTKQDIWSRIQSEADAAITDDSLILEQKVAQFLEPSRGRKLYEAWKRADVAVFDSTSKEDQPVTLRQHAWQAIQKRAVALTEMRPSITLPDAVEQVLCSDEGRSLFSLYQHRHAHLPLDEAKKELSKSADDDATPFLRALGLIVGSQ